MFRGMRRSKQELKVAETVSLLQSATSGVLAVQGDDGYPYAVPMSFAYEDGVVYLHSARTGHKVDAIAADGRVSFAIIAQDDVVQDTFTSHYKSVIVFGKARIATDVEEVRRGLWALARKYSPDVIETAGAEIESSLERTAVVVIDIEHMTGKCARELMGR